MVRALLDYTKQTTIAFREAGVLPDMVQIGNEITNGMLWPDARLPANWDHFADFIKAGIAGVEAGAGAGARPRIMIHIDKGGDAAKTKAFFDKLNSYGVKYDCIGQSYYPWWHGSLNDLRENLIFMANEYRKDIIVVEAAYNWQRRAEAISGRGEPHGASYAVWSRQGRFLVGSRGLGRGRRTRLLRCRRQRAPRDDGFRQVHKILVA
jgi:arabinogalactan endo-1,4-beta-galactosidase